MEVAIEQQYELMTTICFCGLTILVAVCFLQLLQRRRCIALSRYNEMTFPVVAEQNHYWFGWSALSFSVVLMALSWMILDKPNANVHLLFDAISATAAGILCGSAFEMMSKTSKGQSKQAGQKQKSSGPSLAVRIKTRLEDPMKSPRLDRKDIVIMLIVCAAYSLVAFTNLGTMDIPQTGTVLEDEAIIEFPAEVHITQFEYYTGYGLGNFQVLWSADGETYEPANLTKSGFSGSEIEHQRRNLYTWQRYTLDVEAQYIKLIPTSGSLTVLEVGFFDQDGQQLIPSQVTMAENVLTAWTDEQSMIPYNRTYITDLYFDEIYHVRTAYEHLHGIRPFEVSHPPLGKILIALGIQIFGMNSFGWRFMGALAGVCMLPVIYILARMMLTKRRFAVYAAILLAADGMHYAQTRIGTVDSFSVLWIMLMYLFMYRYAQTNFNRQPLRETLVPLFWCGLFFGIGAATKWLCLYAGPGLLTIYIYLMVQRYREYKYAHKHRKQYAALLKGYHKKLRDTLLWSVLFFILIPGAIYLASYTPHMLVTEGEAYTLSDILGNQSYMLNYHADLEPDHVHPFASMWYTWPLDIRPVLFFTSAGEGTVATMSTMGNPLIWWTGIVAVVFLTIMAIRKRSDRSFNLLFLAIGALAQYVPWWFISRETFIYHYFAVIPFLILFIVLWLKELEERFKWSWVFSCCFVGSAVAVFAAFYPVLTGIRIPAEYAQNIRWFKSWPFY